jgi:hypothetical protein
MPLSTRNPANLQPQEIVSEIADLRDYIDQSTRRIYELSRTLHDRMRRMDPGGDSRGIYTTYANSWSRFAGMVQQGLQRTRHADRVLGLLPRNEQTEPQTPAPAPVPVNQAQIVPAPSPLEDFISLYGEEMVHDADGQRQQ